MPRVGLAVTPASLHPWARLHRPLALPGDARNIISLSFDFPWISKSTSLVRQRRTEHLSEMPGTVVQSGKTDAALLSRKCRQKINA